MSVFLSSGSPTRSVDIRRLRLVEHLVGHRLLHQQPRARAADVALVEEDAVDDALDGLVDRGVVEDDVGGLAAELEGDLLVRCPATDFAIARPTSVEPVNATLSTSGWATSARPVSPAPVTMLTTPGGRSACWQISANSSAVSGVVSAGLSTTVLPQASAGAIFHASISSGKFHGMTWPATPSGVRAVAGVLELVGPAGVVEEVGGDGRDVDVARLLDRLAVVDRLQHGELAAALLDDPGDPVEVLRALAPGHPRPDAGVGPAGGLHRGVDVGLVGLGDLGQHLLGGGADRLERLAPCRRRTRR